MLSVFGELVLRAHSFEYLSGVGNAASARAQGSADESSFELAAHQRTVHVSEFLFKCGTFAVCAVGKALGEHIFRSKNSSAFSHSSACKGRSNGFCLLLAQTSFISECAEHSGRAAVKILVVFHCLVCFFCHIRPPQAAGCCLFSADFP